MKEDNKILHNVGTDNPFKVPEGYFENLTQRIMDNLPEQKEQEKKTKNRTVFMNAAKWISGIAAACALLLCVKTFMPTATDGTDAAQATAKTETAEQDYVSEEEYEIEVMRYAMIDREDIYSYLECAE